MKETPEDLLCFAVKTAQDAGKLLQERFHQPHQIRFKGAIDLVTEADRLSEALILSRIRDAFPRHDILTEESAQDDTGSVWRWVIDPLDGTTNYAHGFPFFCVSMALECRGEVLLGVVHHPLLNETFTACKGRGAALNGARIHVSRIADVSRSLLATGFPYDIRESRDDNVNNFIALAKRAQAVRRAGAAALDLAYTAAGRFDGFWELKLAPWDMAAGVLLVTEAGGRASDLFGGPFSLGVPHVLATNGAIHKEMAGILRVANEIGEG